MPIHGFILDFNGVLVDDERLHLGGFRHALAEEGLSLSEEEYYEKYMVYDDRNFFLKFLLDRGQPAATEHIGRLVHRKSSHYFRAIEENIPVIQPSVDFVSQLPAELPVAIASGAARQEINLILHRLELADRIVGIVAAEDVSNGKPHPEAFLKGFDYLKQEKEDLRPRDVVVIEDSEKSISSVHSLSMQCVALTTACRAEQLAEADLVLESLRGWTLEKLEKRLEGK